MKKNIFGRVLSWTLALALALSVVAGGTSVANAAILTDSVTTNIDMPMFQVARSGMNYSVGSIGTGVQTLEVFLQNRGYFSANLVPDQVFDANTKNALALYQAQAHVLSTGYFGPHTRAHMTIVLWFKTNGFTTYTN